MANRTIPTAILSLVATCAVACGNDATPSSSNRGVSSTTEPTSVENAYLVPAFVSGRCAIQVGSTAELRFTISNARSAGTERLLSITTDAAQNVDVPQGAMREIPPRQSLAVGQPIADPAGLSTRSPAVTLTGVRDTVIPAHSVEMSFNFDDYGALTMRVPVEACPTQTSP